MHISHFTVIFNLINFQDLLSGKYYADKEKALEKRRQLKLKKLKQKEKIEEEKKLFEQKYLRYLRK